jgi:hypothetical protein
MARRRANCVGFLSRIYLRIASRKPAGAREDPLQLHSARGSGAASKISFQPASGRSFARADLARRSGTFLLVVLHGQNLVGRQHHLPAMAGTGMTIRMLLAGPPWCNPLSVRLVFGTECSSRWVGETDRTLRSPG